MSWQSQGYRLTSALFPAAARRTKGPLEIVWTTRILAGGTNARLRRGSANIVPAQKIDHWPHGAAKFELARGMRERLRLSGQTRPPCRPARLLHSQLRPSGLEGPQWIAQPPPTVEDGAAVPDPNLPDSSLD